jgi:hypothetical protein
MGKLTAKKLSADETEVLVQAKLAWILGLVQPETIWLVGSAARGEMTDASDIDIVLLFVDSEQKSRSMNVLYRNPCPTEWPTDLLPYTKDEFDKSASKGGGICWLALKEGRILFQREKWK